jgi:hypothetical protein
MTVMGLAMLTASVNADIHLHAWPNKWCAKYLSKCEKALEAERASDGKEVIEKMLDAGDIFEMQPDTEIIVIEIGTIICFRFKGEIEEYCASIAAFR